MDAKTQKSVLTRAAIVGAALDLAAAEGLESITLQAVADRVGLSKSGVFSRAGSREALQKAVIEEFGRRFLADEAILGKVDEAVHAGLEAAGGTTRRVELQRRGQVILRWKREGARQGDVLGRDAHRAPFRQQPPVVAVAARRQVDVAGDGEGDRAHASAPS